METAYQRCGFYDTELINGGPKPHGKNSNSSWKDFVSGSKKSNDQTSRRFVEPIKGTTKRSRMKYFVYSQLG